MNICVYGASSKTLDKSFLDAGVELGVLLAKKGHRLVFGGGCGGLMITDRLIDDLGGIDNVDSRTSVTCHCAQNF